MVAHWGNLLVTGLLAAVFVASVCRQVFTRGVLVPPGTQNNISSFLRDIEGVMSVLEEL